MKVVISVCIFAASFVLAAGAPLSEVFFPDVYYPQPYYRGKRSGYGPAYAAPAPCSAALPLGPGGYYGPVHAGYGGGGGGYGGAAHAYGAPAYGYGGAHYRADEAADDEMLNFSDMDQGMSEHRPMARYGYGAPAAHGSGLAGLGLGAGQLAPAPASGPAFGVFPNANVGGCNAPLLFSCSPSIVPGRLVKSGYGGGAAAAYGSGAGAAAGYGSGAGAIAAPSAYRGAEDTAHHDQQHSEEMSSHSVEHSEEATHPDMHQ